MREESNPHFPPNSPTCGHSAMEAVDGYLFLGELYADRGQGEKAQEMGMDYWLARTQEVLGRL